MQNSVLKHVLEENRCSSKYDLFSTFFVQTNSFKNEKITIIDRNVNFVRELLSRAHFKDNFILLKD